MGVPAWQSAWKSVGALGLLFLTSWLVRGGNPRPGFVANQSVWPSHPLPAVCVCHQNRMRTLQLVGGENFHRRPAEAASAAVQLWIANYFSKLLLSKYPDATWPHSRPAAKTGTWVSSPCDFNHSAHSTTETETSAKRNMNDSGNWLQNWDGSRLFRSDVSVVWNVSQPGHFSQQVSSL